MNRSERPVVRFRLFSSFVVAAATAVVLSPQAQADDLFDPAVPPIVVGGTVDTQSTIVVDPQGAGATPGPINPRERIEVDPSVLPRAPECCRGGRRATLIWWPDASPPVVAVETRTIDDSRTAYLDNHGRFWLLANVNNNLIVERIAGWPAPPPNHPNVTALYPDCTRGGIC
jgi:hypothetical protein